jgi:hypothetical protein
VTEPHDGIENRKHDNGRDGGKEEENLYYTHIRIIVQYSYVYVFLFKYIIKCC